MRKLALIDMDSTIANYHDGLLIEMQKLASPNDPPITDLAELDHIPWLNERQRLVKRQVGFWRNLAPIPLGFSVIDILKEYGFDLTVLTKGPKHTTSAWTEKKDWCNQYLPDVPVVITEEKGIVWGTILFDDWPPYILSWLEHRPRGMVIMLDHPWNRTFYHERVIRIDSAGAFPELRSRLARL